jgi:cysteine desulfurase
MWKRGRTYLDWAAAAPVFERARSVYLAALAAYGNPSAPHAEGRAAKAVLEDARTRIARMAEVKTDGVVFTSGATEANALALLGSVRAHGAHGAHVLYQASQHASVIGAMRMLATEGAEIEEMDRANLASQLRAATVLISMDAVNGETGEIFDTLAVRRILDAHREKTNTRILLHVDASQAPLGRSFQLAALGADIASLDAQKAGGVRGTGALLVRHGVMLAPVMAGGGQEGGRRPGTENAAGAIAFATALAECEEGRKKFSERASVMRTALIAKLSVLSYMKVNEGKENVPHILNVSLIGRDTDYLLALLDADGFAVSTKSACESDSEEGSRAVLALTDDPERAASTLRISWGPTTTESDLDRFADTLVRRVRFLDDNPI